jgi:hypothetical protein
MLRVSTVRRVLRLREALDRAAVGHPIFKGRDVTPASPLFVRCPFCGARPLKECTSMGGRRVKFHQQRRQALRGRR